MLALIYTPSIPLTKPHTIMVPYIMPYINLEGVQTIANVTTEPNTQLSGKAAPVKAVKHIII